MTIKHTKPFLYKGLLHCTLQGVVGTARAVWVPHGRCYCKATPHMHCTIKGQRAVWVPHDSPHCTIKGHVLCGCHMTMSWSGISVLESTCNNSKTTNKMAAQGLIFGFVSAFRLLFS